MLSSIKLATLAVAKTSGVYRLMAASEWRNQRLLILCYHGISLEREHEWRPRLFITPETFEQRLQAIRKAGCNVLPLPEALNLLYAGRLPERSLVITFDDGNHDFIVKAHPLLQSCGYPATVYLTTYYSDRELPVFHLICSYMLWKHRDKVMSVPAVMGGNSVLDLTTPERRDQALQTVTGFAEREGLSAIEKDGLARALGAAIGEDVDSLWGKRVLHLLNSSEVGALASRGVTFQMHTHRHRSPTARDQYRREVQENRASIARKTGTEPAHFCYPSGAHDSSFVSWLAEENVASATTCEPGYADAAANPLLLPRLLDHSYLTPLEFEAWLSGAAHLLPRRAPARRS